MINYVVLGGGVVLLLLGLAVTVMWCIGILRKAAFSKLVVGFLLVNSVIWIYLSYVLAYLGRVEIAQSLSTTVVLQIVGVTLVYCAKALFENISKNNVWPDKPVSIQEFCASEPTDGGDIK